MAEIQKPTGRIEVVMGHDHEEAPRPAAPIAEALRELETPPDLHAFAELSEDIGRKWEDEGFQAPASYVDLSGELIVIAQQQDTQVEEGVAARVRTWRLLIDGEVTTVDVPPHLQGRDAVYDLKMASGKRRASRFQSIYDVRNQNAQTAPPEIARLTSRFGDSLGMMRSEQVGERLQSNGVQFAGQALGEITAEMQRLEDEEKDIAWERAHGTERRAQLAKTIVKVRKKLFMTAQEYTQLKDTAEEEAYRKELARQHRLSDDSF